MDTRRIAAILIDQIKWAQYRDGNYSHRDPLIDTRARLRDIKANDKPFESLMAQDKSLLLKSIHDSIKHISNYDYGNLNGEALRQQALKPLVDAMYFLNNLAPVEAAKMKTQIEYIDIDLIRPSKNPIRKTRDHEAIQALADSIRSQGVLVPIKVRPLTYDGSTLYELVYGSRRWEAAQLVGLETIPAIVEALTDEQAEEQQIIENAQREDMDELEYAIFLKSHKDKYKKTFKQMTALTGKGEVRTTTIISLASRQHIANRLQNPFLKKDDGPVKDIATKAQFIAGPIKDQSLQEKIADKVAREGLSQQKTRAVANSIARAPTSQAKEKLLKWEFNSSIHDPEFVQDRANRLGVHDPLYLDETPTKQEEWERSEEVKVQIANLIDTIKKFEPLIRGVRMMLRTPGKLAPEARQFIASKLRTLVERINHLISELEA